MSPHFDPAHGELFELATGLDAAQAEMLTSDLRDLKIPAVMCPETTEELDGESGELHEVAVERYTHGDWSTRQLFVVFVPEAFLQIAKDVLGATWAQPEGPAKRHEILRDLDEPDKIPDVPQDHKRARARAIGRSYALIAVVVLGAMFALGLVQAIWWLVS